MKVLVTGSSGLIGSELVSYFDERAARIVGMDNNMRADFFGRDGDTRWNLQRLAESTRHFVHHDADIRSREAVNRVFRTEGPFDLIVHSAAQPSHDLATRRPLDDFDVNAVGTINLLEATRRFSPGAVFVLLSTNKVYGDAPNELPLEELDTRWDFARPEDKDGIGEQMRLDRSTHSVFGASKVAADIMTQEYGRLYGLQTVCLRGGCLTGPRHSGVELHGFLSYLVKANVSDTTYRVYGYKGKQVRDNIHSLDVARAIEEIYRHPRPGEVYNIGGGRGNSISILEAFTRVSELTHKPMKHEYVAENRPGDHICYITNLAKFRSHYPGWQITRSLDDILGEIVESWTSRPSSVSPAAFGKIRSDTRPELVQTLSVRERFRDDYWRRKDPIADDRLRWRAQTFRHLVHLLPGESVLELGAGEGRFTAHLANVSRRANPLASVTFGPQDRASNPEGSVELIEAPDFPAELSGRRFSFVVGMDVLDRNSAPWLLRTAYDLLEPGGEIVFYESNPWNPVLRVRRALRRLFGRNDPRELVSRPELYELISEIGYIRTFAVYNDFLFAPLTRRLVWLLRNLSTVLENAPVVRAFAGSILIHAQKPPREVERPVVSLSDRAELRNAVSVVIPCHDEESNVTPLVSRLRELYGDYLHEIVLVDDNSRDSTAAVIRRLAADDPRIKPVFRSPPGGVGLALADGYRMASGRWVMSMDCDFQHLLPEMRDMFDAAADGYDVVIGSRFNRHSVLLNYPFRKVVANRAFHLLGRVILRRNFRDLTNNLKLFRREVLDHVLITEPGFAANAETGFQPLMMGCRIREVPISWINRTSEMGTSSFRLGSAGGGYWRVLYHLVQRQLFRRGRYRNLPLLGGERRTFREDMAELRPRPA